MNTKDIVRVALFAAFTAALALFPPITIPLTGVPITAQSMGPMLAGTILGSRRGLLSQLLFLVLVAAGLPLLAGGKGGLVVFAGPTAGYMVAWPLAAFVIGLMCELYWDRIGAVSCFIFTAIGGIVLVYLIGSAWVSFVAGLSYWQALLANGPFIPGDLVKAALATAVAMTVRRSYPLIEMRRS